MLFLLNQGVPNQTRILVLCIHEMGITWNLRIVKKLGLGQDWYKPITLSIVHWLMHRHCLVEYVRKKEAPIMDTLSTIGAIT